MKELKAIPLSAYKKCIDEWVKRCHTCVTLDGYYYGGGKIMLPEN